MAIPHATGRATPRPESAISDHECRAMRQLDRDPEYTRSEIAFVFECKVETVAEHADAECRHQRLGDEDRRGRQWTDTELLTAYRVVYDKQPYPRMSPGVYEDHRPSDYPSAGTISTHIGSWTDARRLAHGEGVGA